MEAQVSEVLPYDEPNKSLQLTKRQLNIARLIGNPNLTQTQIAEMVGVSRDTVAVVAKKLRDNQVDIRSELEQYQRLLRKQVPHSKSVTVISEVMDAKMNPFARLRAVQYRDQVLGLVAPAAEAVVAQPAPLFSLPNTTSITVNVIRKGD